MQIRNSPPLIRGYARTEDGDIHLNTAPGEGACEFERILPDPTDSIGREKYPAWTGVSCHDASSSTKGSGRSS